MNEKPTFRPDEIDAETGLPFAELQRELNRRTALVGANTDPLPGPLALAFPARPIRVGAFGVRALTGVDICTLRHLDSPLIRQMAEARKPKEERQPTAFTDEDGWEMVLQFLMTPEQAEAAVAKDRNGFRQLARQRIGLGLNPVIIGMLVEAVTQQFASAFTTAVDFSKSAGGEAANADFFTRPPVAPTTASAGGLNTSAV